MYFHLDTDLNKGRNSSKIKTSLLSPNSLRIFESIILKNKSVNNNGLVYPNIEFATRNDRFRIPKI